MVRAIAGFDWDAGNRAKCRKHGVSIEEIEYLFETGPRLAPDVKHSTIEDRIIAIGSGSTGRSIYVPQGRRNVSHPTDERALHAPEGSCGR